MNQALQRFLADLGVKLDGKQEKKLYRYQDILFEASQNLNLISSNDRYLIAEKHLADSLAPVRMIPQGVRLADWGSGGGLPGIPLVIARPDLKVVLLEAKKKKAGFLMNTVDKLGLDNVKVLPRRGEELGERFQAITVRAVGKIRDVVSLVSQHLEPEGAVIFYKGPGVFAELKDAHGTIEGLGLDQRKLEKRTLPTGETRYYLLFHK